jgi:hypothetical protein
MNLRDAVANLLKVKGRHNTEVAYQKLVEAFDAPEKEWVGLTYGEQSDCLVEADPCECLATPEAEELMRSVEAKLKEKNSI